MTQDIVAFIMDGLLLCFLGAAAFFAAKLSRQLKVFRESRTELQKLIADLTGSIGQAERSIEGLRRAAHKAGLDLQDEINDARGLLDELQIMVESGEGLANRLEKGTAKPSRYDLKSRRRSSAGFERPADEQDSFSKKPFTPEPSREEIAMPGMFAIRDPEFENPDYEDDIADDEQDMIDEDYADNYFGDDVPGFLKDEPDYSKMSKAERDLYRALHGDGPRKRTPAGGV